jgi:hypothetical protein
VNASEGMISRHGRFDDPFPGCHLGALPTAFRVWAVLGGGIFPPLAWPDRSGGGAPDITVLAIPLSGEKKAG